MISAASAASCGNAAAAWRNDGLLVRRGPKKTTQLAWAIRFSFKLKIEGSKVPEPGLVSFAGRFRRIPVEMHWYTAGRSMGSFEVRIWRNACTKPVPSRPRMLSHSNPFIVSFGWRNWEVFC